MGSPKNRFSCDFLIIGAGIIGLSSAINLKQKYKNKKIIIIEKEPQPGLHASGRNSGVLHAGFYYLPDSLKAKFTKQGNLELTTYCQSKNLKINKCGKVVVAKSERELETLFELKKRAEKNNVEIYLIDQKELNEIEPNARTYQYALWSPTTSVIEPISILQSLKNDLLDQEVSIYFNTPYIKRIDSNSILAGDSIIEFGKLINCAGLYADKIAKDFGFSQNYLVLPFKGLYIEGNSNFISRNIYPVPRLENPFLGVHFTIGFDNKVKIGPTAIPCFWRENYEGMKNFKLLEFVETLRWNSLLLLKNSSFRLLSISEIKKYWRSYFIREASQLVKEMDKKYFSSKGFSKSGIRAQLLDIAKVELVQDFVVEADKYSVHILNAVSPAFTASFPFTRYIIDKYIDKNQ